ncbi:MAG: leucine-rich repeat domain-containing protein [Saprospiraceae bacterium]|nr:leucine-rich repeat domain-containing protein [Saprospiraceae bacterium]
MTLPQQQSVQHIYQMLCSGIEEQYREAQFQAQALGHQIDWAGLDTLLELAGYDPSDRLRGYPHLNNGELELSGEIYEDSFPRPETVHQLKELPEVLQRLPHLVQLKLNQLEEIEVLPDFLGNIPTLKSLSIINCARFYALPKTLTQLEHLEIIGIHQFAEAPEYLVPLTSLTHLTLSRYGFDQVADIPILKQLKRLELHHLRLVGYDVLNEAKKIFFQNELVIKVWKPALMLVLLGNKGKVNKIEVRGGFGAVLLEDIHEFDGLEELTIYKSESTELPASIGSLHSLKRLNIWCCKTKTLPETLGNLENLEHLHVCFNRVRYLPQSLPRMRSLTHLNAGDNYLSTIPDSIGEMERLEVLRLSHNIISNLPDSLGDIDTLKEVYVDNNRMSRYEVPVPLKKLEEKGTHIIGFNQLNYGWDTLMRVSALTKLLFT